jgi:hypothetical protein
LCINNTRQNRAEKRTKLGAHKSSIETHITRVRGLHTAAACVCVPSTLCALFSIHKSVRGERDGRPHGCCTPCPPPAPTHTHSAHMLMPAHCVNVLCPVRSAQPMLVYAQRVSVDNAMTKVRHFQFVQIKYNRFLRHDQKFA